jgi:hypothetical protein
MIKKISILIFVSVILVCGSISIKKLNYWERTISVLRVNSSAPFFDGRGRGFGESGRGERFEGRPRFGEGIQQGEVMNADSLRPRSDRRGQRFEGNGVNRSDSLRTGRADRGNNSAARGSFDGRIRDMDRPGGREGRGGSTISMRNVVYFLAVFAFFTAIAVCLDKAYCLIRRRKNI